MRHTHDHEPVSLVRLPLGHAQTVELPLSLKVQLDQERLTGWLDRVVEAVADSVAERVLKALDRRVDQPERAVEVYGWRGQRARRRRDHGE